MTRRQVASRLLTALLFMLPAQGSVVLADTPGPMEEETLESKVERRLRMEGRIRWEELRVEADGGQVTLYGIVKSNEERGFAEKAASTVDGVSAVVNKLLVQTGPPSDESPNARINEESRDRVIEGPSGLRDRQILP